MGEEVSIQDSCYIIVKVKLNIKLFGVNKTRAYTKAKFFLHFFPDFEHTPKYCSFANCGKR